MQLLQQLVEVATERVINETEFVGVFCYPLGGLTGAKVGGINYKNVRATVNHKYCPSLKSIVPDSKVPKEARSAFEFPLVGLDSRSLKVTMFVALEAFSTVPGVLEVTAPKSEGRWGTKKYICMT